MDFVNEKIKKTFKISDNQLNILEIKLCSNWSLENTDLMFEEENEDNKHYFNVILQTNKYCSFINCFDINDKEYCFVFPNNRFKYNLSDILTATARSLLFSKLKEGDLSELYNKYIEEAGNTNENTTLTTITTEQRLIHDNILINFNID